MYQEFWLSPGWEKKKNQTKKPRQLKNCMCQLLVFLHNKIYTNAKCFKRYLQGVFFHDLFLLPVEKLHHFLNPRKDKDINPFKTATLKLTILEPSDYRKQIGKKSKILHKELDLKITEQEILLTINYNDIICLSFFGILDYGM